jgi:hypothetical protein
MRHVMAQAMRGVFNGCDVLRLYLGGGVVLSGWLSQLVSFLLLALFMTSLGFSFSLAIFSGLLQFLARVIAWLLIVGSLAKSLAVLSSVGEHHESPDGFAANKV